VALLAHPDIVTVYSEDRAEEVSFMSGFVVIFRPVPETRFFLSFAARMWQVTSSP